LQGFRKWARLDSNQGLTCDSSVARRDLGLSRLATIELRLRPNGTNGGIPKLAAEHGFLLGDLEWLIHDPASLRTRLGLSEG